MLFGPCETPCCSPCRAAVDREACCSALAEGAPPMGGDIEGEDIPADDIPADDIAGEVPETSRSSRPNACHSGAGA